MLHYTLRRIAVAIPTLFLLILLTFSLMYSAPGGPFTSERPLPAAVLANIEAKYGLDQPYHVRVYRYIKGIVTEFDFGPSFKLRDLSVNDIMAVGLSVTLVYGSLSFVFAALVGILLGCIAALRHNAWLDYSVMGLAFLAQVMPNFVMGPLLVLLFALHLEWLPAGGWEDGNWRFMILPIIALSTSYMANIARMMRSSMLEVLHSNYVRTARAKGARGAGLVLRHVLRPALLPVITYLGPVFVYVLCGSLIVDAYFGTGGLGTYFVNAAFSRDYSVMMGLTILYGVLTVGVNLSIDLLYGFLDPKIRYQ